MGHFHWPESGHPPGSPSGCPASRSACEAYRQDYLGAAQQAWAKRQSWLMLGAGATLTVAGWFAWKRWG